MKWKYRFNPGMSMVQTIVVFCVIIVAVIYFIGSIFNGNNENIKTKDIKTMRLEIIDKYGKSGMGTGYKEASTKLTTVDKFPPEIYKDAIVLSDYNYAKSHYMVLEQMPCFCSCVEHSGHTSLRDCYINDDGSYNTHASYCDVCLGEVAMIQNNLEV